MFYEVKFTMPTLKIKTIDDYKERVNEILFWQIKDTAVSKITGFDILFHLTCFEDFLLALFFIGWSIITLPFTLAYIALCFVELLVATLLLPLFLIPIIRIIPTIIETIVWSCSFAIGVFAGAALQRY